jgi:hypothetical protein
LIGRRDRDHSVSVDGRRARGTPERYEGYDVALVIGVDHRDQAFKLAELEDGEPLSRRRVHLWEREKRGLPTIDAIAEMRPTSATMQ